ncbi:MAG: hypothetical protein ACHQE6_05105 [Solirubrobacterales bacterium]
MSKAGLLGVCGALASVLAGCGETAHQDASEARGNFTVLARASFPHLQAVARPVRLVLSVRNTGARTLPDVTVAVTSFSYLSNYPGLASRRRPVWIVDRGPGRVANPPVATVEVDPPGNGTTPNYNIWALGQLKPGATRSFVWEVTPVKPGVHRVFYRVYAGLNGRAQARLAGGGVPGGSFATYIAGRPPRTHVNPQTGRVAAGPYIPPEG